ncbi:hypothetical protein CASFOL_041751 [Castilleja foliolosa]|uniref:Transmembrane protein n=1 Tax=Castilleja foliolosa TaxID=1961234 RepID=A0ABD3B8L1_9LAMI
MATLNCFFHLMMAFVLHSSFLLILFSCFSEKSVALESHFETLESETAPECKRRPFTGIVFSF